jgi:hypothetical protein
MNGMDKLITALAPVFAAGFAVQQLLEIVSSFFDLDSKEFFKKYKKPILGTAAFALGYALARQLDHGVVGILQGSDKYTTIDQLATALIISAGTEGVNSILKFLKYSKEDKKRDAAADPNGTPPAGPPPAPGAAGGLAGGAAGGGLLPPPPAPRATEDALSRINRQ